MTFGDSPMGAQTPADYKDKIMHATLRGARPADHGLGHAAGHALRRLQRLLAVGAGATTWRKASKLFDALAEGGKVTMPYAPTFWATGFGMLVDKFGVPWMVNCRACSAEG